MNILAVTYLPRHERSHTAELFDAALAELDQHTVHTLDLLEDKPDLLDHERVMSYIQRNYLGQELSSDQQAALAKMDAMTNQLVEADAVILATPMYNFSLPATVKAWFDSVMLKGQTWDASDSGYHGLLTDKKAPILMASGGIYEGETAGYDHAMPLAKQEFSFMGFKDVQGVSIQGINMGLDDLAERKHEAKTKVKEVLSTWN